MPAAGGVVRLVWFGTSNLVLARLSVRIPAFVHGRVRGYRAVLLCQIEKCISNGDLDELIHTDGSVFLFMKSIQIT